MNPVNPLEILPSGRSSNDEPASERRRSRVLLCQLSLYILPALAVTLLKLYSNSWSLWQWPLLYFPSLMTISLLLWAEYHSQHPPRAIPSFLAISILVLGMFLSFQPSPLSDGDPLHLMMNGSGGRGFGLANVSVDDWEKLLSVDPSYNTSSSSELFPLVREYDFKNELSVIIIIRDEEEFIAKTISFVLKETPDEILREIIIVDDASSLEASKILTQNWIDKTLEVFHHKEGKIKVVRFNQRQGLIRAKIAGADLSTSPNIFFLDGHCRLDPLWYQPLLDRVNPALVDPILVTGSGGGRHDVSGRDHLSDHLGGDHLMIPAYKRIIIPQIYDIDRFTWKDKNTFGLKMMFDWTFEFDWFEDDSELVPILPGGIQLITRRWWEESGKYDSGMLEWGGENIEQSIRTWLCGGGIIQTNQSRIGHIFDRPAKPNPNNELVIQVQKNQKRAAIVWLDDYYQYIDKYHKEIKTLDPGSGLEYRQYLRSQLQCKPFRAFVNQFKSTFQRRGLLIHEYHYIQHKKSLLCLGASAIKNQLTLQPCARSAVHQQWSSIWGGRFIHNLGIGNCLTKVSNSNKIIVAECSWLKMLHNLDHDQFWQYSNGSIFTNSATNTRSKDGNDEITGVKKVFCVSDELQSTPCEQLPSDGIWQILW